MIAFLAAFVRGFRDAGTLAETLDENVRLVYRVEALTLQLRNRSSAMALMAAELNEYREFLSVLSAEQLPEASERKP